MGIFRNVYIGDIKGPFFEISYQLVRIYLFISTIYGFLKTAIMTSFFLIGNLLTLTCETLVNLDKFTIRLQSKLSRVPTCISKLKWIVIASRSFNFMYRLDLIIISIVGMLIVLYNFLIIRGYQKVHIIIYCCVPVLESVLWIFLFVFFYLSNKVYELSENIKFKIDCHLHLRDRRVIHKQIKSLETICIHMGIMNYNVFYITRSSASSVYMTIVLYSIDVLLAFGET